MTDLYHIYDSKAFVKYLLFICQIECILEINDALHQLLFIISRVYACWKGRGIGIS